MAVVTGLNCKLYRNTGTYGSPTWNELPNVRDVTLNQTSDTADASKRASSYKLNVTTLKDLSVNFEMVYVVSDDDWTTLKTAFYAGTAIEFAIVNGPIATSGTLGVRGTFQVKDFTISQGLNDVEKASVVLSLTEAANAPSEMSISA